MNRVHEKVVVTKPEELDLLTDVIHDRWVDVDKIVYDLPQSTLVVPFQEDAGLHRKQSTGQSGLDPGAATMRISNVLRYTIQDSEGIGRYDFNFAHFDADEGRLEFITNIPTQFVVWVTSLYITVTSES